MASAAGRSYASGVQINFGLVQITGNLYKPVETNDTEKLRVVCPDDHQKVVQMYECPDHGSMLPANTARAKELDDGTLVPMTEQQVKAAKESQLPEKLFEMRVHERAEIGPSLVNGEGCYVFLPGDVSSTSYGILRDLITNHPEFVFIGMINLKKNDKLFRLQVGMNDQLVFQEVVWFSDVKTMPETDAEYVPKLYGMAENLVTSLLEPFDPADYSRAARERMAAAIAEASGTPQDGTRKPAAKPKALDLELMLSTALEATKGKKAPAKKAAGARKAPVRKAS